MLHTYLLQQNRQRIYPVCVIADQPQDDDKRSQTTFVDVKLHSFPYRQQTAAGT